jgi:hypothetical protein
VAPIALVEENALDGVADQRLHLGDDDCKRVAVIGVAGQRLHMGHELTAVCTENLSSGVVVMKSAQDAK